MQLTVAFVPGSNIPLRIDWHLVYTRTARYLHSARSLDSPGTCIGIYTLYTVLTLLATPQCLGRLFVARSTPFVGNSVTSFKRRLLFYRYEVVRISKCVRSPQKLMYMWIKGALAYCLFSFLLFYIFFLATCARWSWILSFRVHVKLAYRIVSSWHFTFICKLVIEVVAFSDMQMIICQSKLCRLKPWQYLKHISWHGYFLSKETVRRIRAGHWQYQNPLKRWVKISGERRDSRTSLAVRRQCECM